MIHSIENRPYGKPPKRLLPWLLLGLLLIVLLLVGQWLWLMRSIAGAETPILLPSERAPLLMSLRGQPAIFWSTIITGVALVLALLVAVSPLPWWMYLMATLGWGNGARLARVAVQQQKAQSAEAWVAEQAAFEQAAQAQTNPADPSGAQATASNQPATGTVQPPGTQPAGVQPPGTQPGVQQPGAPQLGAPQPGTQPPGTVPPGAPQPATQPAQPGTLPPGVQPPGVPPPPGTVPPGAPTATPPAQPGAQPPGAPPSQDLQALLEEEKKLDIGELTDIGDMLSSFKESDEISPYLVALSNSLDDVDVMTLSPKANQIAAQLAAGERRPTAK